MLTAIKLLTTILTLTVSEYQYSNPTEFIEMVSYATNTVICKQAPEKDRHNFAACHAVCATDRFWFSDDDIDDLFGSVCRDIEITNKHWEKNYDER